MGASRGEGDDSKGKDPFYKAWEDPERMMTGTQFWGVLCRASDQEEINLRQGCDCWGIFSRQKESKKRTLGQRHSGHSLPAKTLEAWSWKTAIGRRRLFTPELEWRRQGLSKKWWVIVFACKSQWGWTCKRGVKPETELGYWISGIKVQLNSWTKLCICKLPTWIQSEPGITKSNAFKGQKETKKSIVGWV